MKRAIFLALPAAALLAVGCSSSTTASDDIVARVNGKEITTAELEKEFQSRTAGAQQAPTPEEALAAKFQIVNQMINDRILLEMASSNGLNASDAEVDTRFTDIKSQYTDEQFQEMLKQQKVTPDGIKAEIRKSMTLEKLITKEITSRINVSEVEIKDLFDKNKQSFNLPEGYHLLHIMVTPLQDPQVNNAKRDDAKNPAEAQAKASRLLRDVQGGQDFGVVARDWSEDTQSAPNGGDLGFRALSDMEEIDPKVSQAVSRLKVGETTGLIESRFGYHILKLTERDTGGQKDLTSPQVQAQIRQAIFNRKEEMLRAAFSETARNKAQVNNYFAERLLESVGKAPAAAPAKKAEEKAEDKKDAEKK